MNTEPENDAQWKKLMSAVFPPHEHPFPEAFVTRVMSHLEAQPPKSHWFSKLSWRIPALVAGALTAALLLIIQPQSGKVTTESLLLVDGNEEEMGRLAFQNEPPQADDLLAFTLEAK